MKERKKKRSPRSKQESKRCKILEGSDRNERIPGQSEVSTSNSCGETTKCPKVPDLPGFYYDEEKKKYFRIQKDPNNRHLSYSNESLREKTKNEQNEQHMRTVYDRMVSFLHPFVILLIKLKSPPL
jgi:hypothetical protein